MNVDLILETMNRHRVRFLMLGGMNILLRHASVRTCVVDLWIEDSEYNRNRCEQALANLDAEWGASDESWQLTSSLPAGWLTTQVVFCLNAPAGAIDIFRSVHGLADWQTSFQNSIAETTRAGVPYRGLSDADMLRCQYALDEPFRKQERMAVLEASLKQAGQALP